MEFGDSGGGGRAPIDGPGLALRSAEEMLPRNYSVIYCDTPWDWAG